VTRRRCRDPYRRWTFQRRAVDGAKQLSELSASFPGALTSWGFKALASSQLLFGARRPTFNVGVSNVPGPQAPLYMNGARVERFFGVAPIFHGTALVFGVFSYRGAIDVTFVSCRRIVPDPAFLAECLQASYDELLAIAQSPAAVTDKFPRRTRPGRFRAVSEKPRSVSGLAPARSVDP